MYIYICGSVLFTCSFLTLLADKFCWFVNQADKAQYIEEHREVFFSALYSVYRAADVMFTGETQLEAARALSKRILYKKQTLKSSECSISVFSTSNLQDNDQVPM